LLKESLKIVGQEKSQIVKDIEKFKSKLYQKESEIQEIRAQLEREECSKAKLSRSFDELALSNRELAKENNANMDVIADLRTKVERHKTRLG